MSRYIVICDILHMPHPCPPTAYAMVVEKSDDPRKGSRKMTPLIAAPSIKMSSAQACLSLCYLVLIIIDNLWFLLAFYLKV